MGVEKEIFKELMHFHYMTYMATPKHKNPCPGSHEIYKFGRPFLGQHYYTLSLYGPRTGAEKNFLWNTSIFHFLPKITFPWGGGHEIYKILVS